MARFSRADVVLVPFPFIVISDIKRKLRPALAISDHSKQRRYSDVILILITSRVPTSVFLTEVIIEQTSPYFPATGLAKTSMVRCEVIMTLPEDVIVKKIGIFHKELMVSVDQSLKTSVGI